MRTQKGERNTFTRFCATVAWVQCWFYLFISTDVSQNLREQPHRSPRSQTTILCTKSTENLKLIWNIIFRRFILLNVFRSCRSFKNHQWAAHSSSCTLTSITFDFATTWRKRKSTSYSLTSRFKHFKNRHCCSKIILFEEHTERRADVTICVFRVKTPSKQSFRCFIRCSTREHNFW